MNPLLIIGLGVAGVLVYGMARAGTAATKLDITLAGASINLKEIGIDSLLSAAVPGAIVLRVWNDSNAAVNLSTIMLRVMLGDVQIATIENGQLHIPARSHANYQLHTRYQLTGIIGIVRNALSGNAKTLSNVRVVGSITAGAIRIPIDNTTALNII